MPKMQIFTHPRLFFVLTYASMPAPKKYPTQRKSLTFWVLRSLKRIDFCSVKAQTARNADAFRGFVTQTGPKYAALNHIGLDSRRLYLLVKIISYFFLMSKFYNRQIKKTTFYQLNLSTNSRIVSFEKLFCENFHCIGFGKSAG